jgi:DNA-binding MarR family transcriptional regulator
MSYQITSYLAFEEVLMTLGDRQKLVLSAIKKIQPCSNLEISKYLNLPINTVTPRCQELRKKGLVVFYKSAQCKYTNRTVNYYKIPEWVNGVLQ